MQFWFVELKGEPFPNKGKQKSATGRYASSFALTHLSPSGDGDTTPNLTNGPSYMTVLGQETTSLVSYTYSVPKTGLDKFKTSPCLFELPVDAEGKILSK